MSRAPFVLSAVVLMFAAGPTASLADEGSGPAPGARVRVTASGLSRPVSGGKEATTRLVGTLLAVDDEAVTLEVERQKDHVVVPRSSLLRLETSRRSSKKAVGALLGFLAGTAAGAIAVSASGGSSLCNSTGLSGCDLVAGAVVMGLPGALVGALVAPGERWESVTLGHVGLTVAPARARGITAAISFSF